MVLMLIMIFTELLMIYLNNTLYNDWQDKIKLFNGLQALFPFSLVCSLNIVYLFKYLVSPLKKKKVSHNIINTPNFSQIKNIQRSRGNENQQGAQFITSQLCNSYQTRIDCGPVSVMESLCSGTVQPMTYRHCSRSQKHIVSAKAV